MRGPIHFRFLGIRGEVLLAVVLATRVIPSDVSKLFLLPSHLRIVEAPLHFVLGSALFGCL